MPHLLLDLVTAPLKSQMPRAGNYVEGTHSLGESCRWLPRWATHHASPDPVVGPLESEMPWLMLLLASPERSTKALYWLWLTLLTGSMRSFDLLTRTPWRGTHSHVVPTTTLDLVNQFKPVMMNSQPIEQVRTQRVACSIQYSQPGRTA